MANGLCRGRVRVRVNRRAHHPHTRRWSSHERVVEEFVMNVDACCMDRGHFAVDFDSCLSSDSMCSKTKRESRFQNTFCPFTRIVGVA